MFVAFTARVMVLLLRFLHKKILRREETLLSAASSKKHPKTFVRLSALLSPWIALSLRSDTESKT